MRISIIALTHSVFLHSVTHSLTYSFTQSITVNTRTQPTQYSFTRSPTLSHLFLHSLNHCQHTHTLEHRYESDRTHFIYVDDVIQGRMNPYRLAGHEYGKACVFQLRLNATSSSIRIRLGGKDESGQEMQPTGNSKDVVVQAFTLRKIANLYISEFKIDTVPPTATLYYDENMYVVYFLDC